MKICFDIDGTICTFTNGKYQEAVPYPLRILHINKLIEQGHEVFFFTARGSETGIDWSEFTKKQLKSWGILNPYIYFGKPSADLYIDDRAVSDYNYEW